MKVLKEDIKKAAGCLQLCAGQETGCEAVIHALHKIFESNKTDAILTADGENAFNSINQKALLHNIKYLCPAIATFLYNCYAISARLFIIGGKELRSSEGTTQGGPIAMAAYALGLTSLLDHLHPLLDHLHPKCLTLLLTGGDDPVTELNLRHTLLLLLGLPVLFLSCDVA